MRHAVLFFTFVFGIVAIGAGANAAAVRVASVDYVDNATITLESTSNKVDAIDANATDAQYPSALAVSNALDARVDVRETADQTMAGTYTVTGSLIVPTQPLPSAE